MFLAHTFSKKRAAFHSIVMVQLEKNLDKSFQFLDGCWGIVSTVG